MNWAQLLKNAVIVAIGTPLLYWLLVQVLGGGEEMTARTYILLSIASVIGGTIGEIFRQKTR